MAEPKTDALVKALESLVAEKQAVTSQEKELVDGLNAVFSKMGYRVVAATAVPKHRGRPPGSKDAPDVPRVPATAAVGADLGVLRNKAPHPDAAADRRRQRLTSGPVQLKSGFSSGTRPR